MVPDFKSVENLKILAQSQYLQERLVEEESQVMNVRIIFRNIVLSVTRMHIRYEDDYYQADLGRKFAFGMTIERIFVVSGSNDWTINRDNSAQGSHFGRQFFDS
jgi:phosphatidylglycerophosphate synthase